MDLRKHLGDLNGRENKTIIAQYFEGGHGKTGEIDGTIFGAQGVGGGVVALMQKERLTTTNQLVSFLTNWKAQNLKNEDDKWLFTEWIPDAKRKECTKFIQKRLQDWNCFQSTPEPHRRGGFSNMVKVKLHGIIERKNPQSLENCFHYKIEKYKYTAEELKWKLAASQVETTQDVNTDTLEKRKSSYMQLLESQQYNLPDSNSFLLLAAPKTNTRDSKKNGKRQKCSVKWELDLDKVKKTNTKVQTLQEECRRHNLPSTDTGKEILIKKLKDHDENFIHDVATKYTRSVSIASFFQTIRDSEASSGSSVSSSEASISNSVSSSSSSSSFIKTFADSLPASGSILSSNTTSSSCSSVSGGEESTVTTSINTTNTTLSTKRKGSPIIDDRSNQKQRTIQIQKSQNLTIKVTK